MLLKQSNQENHQMTEKLPLSFFVFAYNYSPDGVCTKARPMSKYSSRASATAAARALLRWYDEVSIL